ncbi:hypothetical protein ACFE04_030606 [Oxalis oulophora]
MRRGSRFEDKPPRGSGQPPSRHIWVGNLHHSVDEGELTDQFAQFGELDSVAFQPGRSYAFINFRNEDDAMLAFRELKGFPLAGNPLRIEFAKANTHIQGSTPMHNNGDKWKIYEPQFYITKEHFQKSSFCISFFLHLSTLLDKSSASSQDEEFFQRRGDQYSAVIRGSPYSQRDSRARQVASPNSFHQEEPRTSGKDGEPSEVLWIGFPALLKVDEAILRKAFSPFGVIEKISVFPGRSYAFVRFRNIMSACRAKENLHGKLFGNPRVHICFARSESGSSSNSARKAMNMTPSPPSFNPNGRLGPADGFRSDMNLAGDHLGMRSHFVSGFDPVDIDPYRYELESWRHTEMGSELGPTPDFYDHHRSPKRKRRDFTQRVPHKGSVYEEDQWELPEDPYFSDRAKKQKPNSYQTENELPEYLFSDREEERQHAFSRRFSDSPQLEVFDKNFETGSHRYNRPTNSSLARGERSDQWRGRSSYDGFQHGSGSLPPKPVERKIFTPELKRSSLRDWKWEGTIAKGGTPVCQARCLPVGKVMDIMLPEFLDCTARTGLDMLAKHYYQATASWVVFFTPRSDTDIGLYNEFMHYLEEKQRAAVAKLDDTTTLFLVPPSDFSEKILRVPGRLSISGVVLRLEHPNADIGSLPPHTNETTDRNYLPYHPDTSYPKLSSPFSSEPSLTDSNISSLSFLRNLPSGSEGYSVRNVSDSYNNSTPEYLPSQRNPTWSPHHPQNSLSDTRNMHSQNFNTSVGQEQYSTMPPRDVQQTSSDQYYPGSISSSQETKINLRPEQLAQLASTLLGKQRQSTGNATNQSDNNAIGTAANRYQSHDNSEPSNYQFGQAQQQPMIQSGTQVSQQTQANNSTREEGDTDPQKRLQATLQLAATLLQQIQQGKRS